ncbi:phenylacetic acid degradation protein [Tepiditoga spiralis]|uniref:Phenylacetic acid degradation protein n=1 Tax=Tepiditoga spiralis TaxID=2108365 RepID=A0A7G1G8G5_9BACT|nr:PaaI family thioesterase [Tepiditoga spiralis]BBE31706.1 phenylacetic acid degradation protein [Tepiditoga spiralis]
MELNNNSMSFAWGKENEKGLKLDIDFKEGKSNTKFSLNKSFCGWADVIHGGIIATILDEVMAWSVISLDKRVVTAEMNIKYKKPLYSNTEYKAFGEIIENKKRVFKTYGKIVDTNGKILAESYGTYMAFKG